MTRHQWRQVVGRKARRSTPLLVRLVAVVVVGWVSGLAGLWWPGAGAASWLGHHSPAAESQGNLTVFAAPRHQEEEATPTPESGDFTVQPTALDTPTPTPTTTAPPPLPPSPVSSPSPIPYVGDLCFGDEQVTYVPEAPRTSNELVIAVSSRYQNKYPRIAGTEKATFLRERPGQLGYVWEWSIQLTWPGQHEYVFYVDSTIPCTKLQVQVRQQFYTRTPTPTKTPKPTNENDD